MPKAYIASQAEHVEYERTCSNCSYKWLASFDIDAKSYVHSTGEKAAKEVAQYMEIEKEDRFRNRDVLCPKCEHFSVHAMNRHFRKGGLAGGILKKYKRAMWENLISSLGYGCLPALILFLAGGKLNPLDSQTPALSIIGLVIVVGAGSVAFYRVAGFVLGLAALSSVRRKLSQLSDEHLLGLAVSCYKDNKDSLDGAGLENIKWNAWFTKPLFYKAAGPRTEQVTP
jgi:hypothetical protein